MDSIITEIAFAIVLGTCFALTVAGTLFRVRPERLTVASMILFAVVFISMIIFVSPDFFPAIFVFYPPTLLIPATAAIGLVLRRKEGRRAKQVLFLTFAANLVALAAGFTYLASPGNTWFNSRLVVGLVQVLSILPLLAMLIFIHGFTVSMGIAEAAVGIGALFVIGGFGFPHNEWVGEIEIAARWGILCTCVALSAEGFLITLAAKARRFEQSKSR